MAEKQLPEYVLPEDGATPRRERAGYHVEKDHPSLSELRRGRARVCGDPRIRGAALEELRADARALA